MELITIEELVDKLSNMIDENVVFIFEGDIVGDIDMKLFRVKKDDDYLEIRYNKAKRKVLGDSIKINIHQITKIEMEDNTEFYIHLDGRQKILIYTDMLNLIYYRLERYAKIDY